MAVETSFRFESWLEQYLHKCVTCATNSSKAHSTQQPYWCWSDVIPPPTQKHLRRKQKINKLLNAFKCWINNMKYNPSFVQIHVYTKCKVIFLISATFNLTNCNNAYFKVDKTVAKSCKNE